MTRILTVRAGSDGEREAALLKWGLVPFWADDPKIGARMLNARSETAATKPAFRAAVRKRRCVIVADGFYEWAQRGKQKQAFHMHHPDRRPFAMAGLWEHWVDFDGAALDTCTILTAEAGAELRAVHHRMPCVLDPASLDPWLDAGTPVDEVGHLLATARGAEKMAITPVSSAVNSVRNDDPSLWIEAPLALDSETQSGQ